MKQKMNVRDCVRKVLCCLLVVAMLPLGALTAFAEGEYIRNLSVKAQRTISSSTTFVMVEMLMYSSFSS